jgi:RNA polymerase sigma-70 factor (ECF subfamily)
MTTASRVVARVEMRHLLQEALNGMDPVDREVIALRHFEELSNDEAAATLGLTKAAASKRYVRAMLRLKDVIKKTPGLSDSDPSREGNEADLRGGRDDAGPPGSRTP